jgi:hypothetical protein
MIAVHLHRKKEKNNHPINISLYFPLLSSPPSQSLNSSLTGPCLDYHLMTLKALVNTCTG